MRAPFTLVLLAAAAAWAALAGAVTADAPSALETFQQREDLLFRVGYRLATANAPFCDKLSSAPGLLLHDAAAYGNPAAVRKTFGLVGDIGVQSVAPGSPAALAGLHRNDTLTAIAGTEITAGWPATRPGWKRAQVLRDAIDAALAAGQVELDWTTPSGDQRTARIGGVPACASRFELLDSGTGAAADGARVQVDGDFPGFAYSEEIFAAAIAHELAHNLLDHLSIWKKYGSKGRIMRLSERDADRLMPWLLANAGYRPQGAVQFMELWGPRHDGGLLRNRSHDGWDERAEFIAAELPKVAQGMTEDGHADWKHRFEQTLTSELKRRDPIR